MDTLCKEFRDHHRQHTEPGEYCTIEFTRFQLKKYDPLVSKTIKIITVLSKKSKFCILAFECNYSHWKETRISTKWRNPHWKERKKLFLSVQ